MSNTYGLSLLLGMTLACYDIYCMSDLSEEKLLSAIVQLKVNIIQYAYISHFRVNIILLF